MTLPVDPERFVAYLVISLSMCFFPGPANMFATATGLRRGHRAVYGAVFGMLAANLTWFVGAAAGLGAVMAAFPQMFRALAYVGAAYLVWLAWTTWRGRDALAAEGHAPPPRRSAFVEGFMVQMTNPKALLFFSVVLPAFVARDRPLVPQLIMLAIPAVGADAVAMTAYGVGGAALSQRMRNRNFRHGFAAVTALLLVGAAILVTISE